MRTEMSRTIGGVQLDAAVPSGAITELNDRFGNLHQMLRECDRPNMGNVMRMLTILVAAGSPTLGLSDAEAKVGRAYEQGGGDKLCHFLGALLIHQHTKDMEAAEKAWAGSVETDQPFDPALLYKVGAHLGLTPAEIRDASVAEILTLWSARMEALHARAGRLKPMTTAELEALMERYPDE